MSGKELIHDIYSGITVGASHSIWWVKNMAITNFVRPIATNILGYDDPNDPNVRRKKRLEEGGEEPTLKVIAVGYGRTGTYSLTMALEELGYPTLHTQHMYEISPILNMWTSKVFTPSIQSNTVSMGKPDFDLIASYGFTATADLPMALYFEELMEYYPQCQFILTTRENSNVWYRSWDIMTRGISQPAQVGNFIPHVRKLGYYMRWLFSIVNQDETFLNVPFPLPGQNRDMAIASYEEHNRRVRDIIPPQRLLEYNVKQGYQPLCDFLNISTDNCPVNKPFPKSNSARAVKIQTISSFIVPLTVVMFIIFFLFSVGFKRITGKTVSRWIQSARRPLLEKLSKKNNKNDVNRMMKKGGGGGYGGGKKKTKQQQLQLQQNKLSGQYYFHDESSSSSSSGKFD